MIHGGEGRNRISGQAHGDELYGGGDRDVIIGGGGGDTLSGYGGKDKLKAGTRKDLVHGGAGDDRVSGNRHDDILFGGGGDDVLIGGGHDDRLDGGPGDDRMRGGTGSDTFVFAAGHGRDRIEDFDIDKDRLLIDNALVAGASASDLAALAEVTAHGVLLGLSDEQHVMLDGLVTLSGLAGAIDLTEI